MFSGCLNALLGAEKGCWEGFALYLVIDMSASVIIIFLLIPFADQNHSEEAGGRSQMEKLRPQNIWLSSPLQRR